MNDEGAIKAGYTHKMIMNERGTTIINFETGEERYYPERPLTWTIDDNGGVWFNAPCSTTLEHFDKDTTEHEIVFYVGERK